MRIELRDIDPRLYEAWEDSFRGVPDVSVSVGDIFGGPRCDAIISPANSFGFMDGGIDLVYSRRFGWGLQTRLQQKIQDERDGELVVGDALIVPTEDPEFPFLVSAPTMRVPMAVPETMNAYLAFRAAILAIQGHNKANTVPIRSVLCPGLATAIGRMPPSRCAVQMRVAWDGIFGDTHALPLTLGARREADTRLRQW
jgi:O-acetyl-ADP-ribose deacetylase (regulator of RNase III)